MPAVAASTRFRSRLVGLKCLKSARTRRTRTVNSATCQPFTTTNQLKRQNPTKARMLASSVKTCCDSHAKKSREKMTVLEVAVMNAAQVTTANVSGHPGNRSGKRRSVGRSASMMESPRVVATKHSRSGAQRSGHHQRTPTKSPHEFAIAALGFVEVETLRFQQGEELREHFFACGDFCV